MVKAGCFFLFSLFFIVPSVGRAAKVKTLSPLRVRKPLLLREDGVRPPFLVVRVLRARQRGICLDQVTVTDFS